MLIVYSKADGKIIENTGKNEAFPLGIPETSSLLEHIASTNGGTPDDYGIIRLHDIEEKDIVEKTFTNLYSVEKGQLVFGGLIPVQEPEPQPPTAEEKIALLEEENAMLQMSIMELAMYAAGQEETIGTQDARITTQESAVMELSMLVAGGMM